MSQSAECSTSYSSEPMSQPTWWGWASRKLVAQAESACHDISKEQRRCEYEDGADGVRFLQCRTVITQFRVCQDIHHNQVLEQISVKVVETREPVDAVKQSSPEPAQSPQPEQHAQAHLPSIDHEGLPPQVAIFMDDFLNFANELERNPVIRGVSCCGDFCCQALVIVGAAPSTSTGHSLSLDYWLECIPQAWCRSFRRAVLPLHFGGGGLAHGKVNT